MTLKKATDFLTFPQKDTVYTFLPTGDVFTFLHKNFLINQFRGNKKDGSVNNIYLRIFHNGKPEVYPLLGIRSKSMLTQSKNSLIYQGTAGTLQYKVAFQPVSNIWFWNVTLIGQAQSADLIYGQDIGIGDANAIYTNELYVSQYLGHSIFTSDHGYVVCSRQNMETAGSFPYLQQGILGAKAEHFSTDGLQFFGLSCKETEIPEALAGNLQDTNLQYEFAYTALQTEKFHVDGKKEITFYGIFKKNHPEAVTRIEYQEELEEAYNMTKKNDFSSVSIAPVHVKDTFGSSYASPDFTNEEICSFFPRKNLEETQNGILYSFFTPDHAHVVTKAKELACDRPHGTIIATPADTERVSSTLIASTHYMSGIFNSHVTIGNTDMHKIISTPRGFLNLMKNSGQRLYIRLNGVYRLLTVPGLFEMGMNYSRWYYKLPDDILTVTAYSVVSSPELVLEVDSQNRIAYDYIITSQLTAGPNESVNDIEYTPINNGLRFFVHTDEYPGLHYDLLLPQKEFTVSDDRIFFTDGIPHDETFLTLSVSSENSFSMIIQGNLNSSEKNRTSGPCFETEKNSALKYYSRLIGHFHLENPDENEQIAILNETVWWYAHNAMIHFSMPHGLEQPGGAAWGTRDVCQGPFEFFLATQHYSLLRSILLNIFSHQNHETREWPQWFMFDRYSMNAGDCHGDVIFWPLKCVADYIQASGDYGILKEILPYDDNEDQKETLSDHIRLALSNIKEIRFIGKTGLITYAGGDWDDTLQPANESLKQNLVSAWTQALAYQTFRQLSLAIACTEPELSAELCSLAKLVKESFHEFLIKDDIIAGFLETGETYHYLLHPSDTKTGIHYRLLPMTRSIISELVDPKQARDNIRLIQDKLKCPDGVRLMDQPADYQGGISRLFKRAEQAANVGREISLQYTHAHIRYIEAIAKAGLGQEAWDSLFVINPILLKHSVPNARVRQSNMYFSSSEGAYNDRYEYKKNFYLLKTGEIEVKGGWRLYSSGPGIYLRQLISNVFGIRFQQNELILDPVLPRSVSGTTLSYDCWGRTFHFEYRCEENTELYAKDCNGSIIPCTRIKNPYRQGGIRISKEALTQCSDTIKIYYCLPEEPDYGKEQNRNSDS